MGADGVLVSFPVFKTECPARVVGGEFDSHTLPPRLFATSRSPLEVRGNILCNMCCTESTLFSAWWDWSILGRLGVLLSFCFIENRLNVHLTDLYLQCKKRYHPNQKSRLVVFKRA